MRVGLKPRLEEITDSRRTTGRRLGGRNVLGDQSVIRHDNDRVDQAEFTNRLREGFDIPHVGAVAVADDDPI
jgi:hypothetical protein